MPRGLRASPNCFMRKRRAAPSFLHPLGGPDAKRLGWGRSQVRKPRPRLGRRIACVVGRTPWGAPYRDDRRDRLQRLPPSRSYALRTRTARLRGRRVAFQQSGSRRVFPVHVRAHGETHGQAMLESPGSISLNSCKRLGPTSVSTSIVSPITLPPGHGKLAAKPAATGSRDQAMTLGTVLLASRIARAAWSPPLTTSSTRSARSSVASADKRSSRPSKNLRSTTSLLPSR